MAKKLSDSDMSADNGNLGPISAGWQRISPFGASLYSDFLNSLLLGLFRETFCIFDVV
jgi:hypothetical protein